MESTMRKDISELIEWWTDGFSALGLAYLAIVDAETLYTDMSISQGTPFTVEELADWLTAYRSTVA